MTWQLRFICCGRDEGTQTFDTWDEADAFRESYTSGVGVDGHGYSGDGWKGHQRAAILSAVPEPSEGTATTKDDAHT